MLGRSRRNTSAAGLAVALSLLLNACSGAPELAEAPEVAGPPPVILPLDEVIASAGVPAVTDADAAALAARAAALRARAAGMQGGGEA